MNSINFHLWLNISFDITSLAYNKWGFLINYQAFSINLILPNLGNFSFNQNGFASIPWTNKLNRHIIGNCQWSAIWEANLIKSVFKSLREHLSVLWHIAELVKGIRSNWSAEFGISKLRAGVQSFMDVTCFLGDFIYSEYDWSFINLLFYFFLIITYFKCLAV